MSTDPARVKFKVTIGNDVLRRSKSLFDGTGQITALRSLAYLIEQEIVSLGEVLCDNCSHPMGRHYDLSNEDGGTTECRALGYAGLFSSPVCQCVWSP